MKSRLPLIGFCLATLCLAGGAAMVRGGYENVGDADRQKMMEEHYNRAIQFFNEGNYSKAINHWEEILKLDPEQTSPPDMIRQAKAKLAEQLEPLETTLRKQVVGGQYSSALATAKELSEKDPDNENYKNYKTKLENISALRPEETGKGRTSYLIRRGVTTHISNPDNAKFAINAIRYARDLTPKHPHIQELVDYMEGQYPDIAKKENVTQGMSVVEYKLFLALNHIYEGRYDLAIFDCNEVLELDPDNILAFKRKGSAYFALKQKDKAREIWKQALKRAPNDVEIKKFLGAK